MVGYRPEPSGTRGNLAGDVARHIRRSILSGRMKAGERVEQDAIAQELGVSRIPVREALIALDQEGLVTAIPRKGVYVASLNRDDILDHYQIFGQLAGLAAARAVLRLEESDIAELELLQGRMLSTVGALEQQHFNHGFHRLINLGAGSRRITSMLGLLSRSLPMPYSDFPSQWLQEASVQHAEILDALKRRDTLAAQRSMEQHISASARHALEVLELKGFFEQMDEEAILPSL